MIEPLNIRINHPGYYLWSYQAERLRRKCRVGIYPVYDAKQGLRERYRQLERGRSEKN